MQQFLVCRHKRNMRAVKDPRAEKEQSEKWRQLPVLFTVLSSKSHKLLTHYNDPFFELKSHWHKTHTVRFFRLCCPNVPLQFPLCTVDGSKVTQTSTKDKLGMSYFRWRVACRNCYQADQSFWTLFNHFYKGRKSAPYMWWPNFTDRSDFRYREPLYSLEARQGQGVGAEHLERFHKWT